MMALSGPVGIKEEIFGSGIKDFIPFSLSHTRNEHVHPPILSRPEGSSDQEAGPFSRLLSREGAKDSSSSFGSMRDIAFSPPMPLKPRCEGAGSLGAVKCAGG